MDNLNEYLTAGWGLAHEAYSNLTWEWVINRILTAPARYRRWWLHLVEHAPGHVVVETGLILFIIWLLFKKTEDPNGGETHLSEKEIDELVREWKPEPLTPEPDPVWHEDPNIVVTRLDGNNLLHAQGYAVPLLNLATFDFLALGQRTQVKDAARACLNKYGCGSCGPRGFYGTIDAHVHCEEAVARFLGTEEAISYSDSASAVSSTLPAFAKRGDLLLVDEGVHEPILMAINLSRSTVKFFKHNDMSDLERLLKSIDEEDRRVNRNTLEQRRFIVVEGLYKNFGDTAKLRDLIALKKRFHYRLFMDETYSFGCFGKGRGVTELYGVPIGEIDILTVSMAHALASVGGLCVGTTEVVDHQRLSGAGYCFSASAPPFVSGAAMAAIKILEEEPELVTRLQENATHLHDGIRQTIAGLEVRSERGSPILHVGMAAKLSREESGACLRRISRMCLNDGVAIVTSKYAVDDKSLMPPPTLRITVNAAHTREQLERALSTLRKASEAVAAELTDS